MNGPIDNHDEVHCMSRRGSPPPTPEWLGPGPESRRSLSPSSSLRHQGAERRIGGTEAARPSAQLRGSCPRDAGREAEDDSPAYEMICLPTKESGAVPPYEVIPGDTAPYGREDQTSESGGLSRILNFELQELQEMTMTYELILVQFFFRCSHVSEEMICMRLIKTLSA